MYTTVISCDEDLTPRVSGTHFTYRIYDEDDKLVEDGSTAYPTRDMAWFIGEKVRSIHEITRRRITVVEATGEA